MEEVVKKSKGKKATIWVSNVGEVTQTGLTRLLAQAMKDGNRISINDTVYTKVTDGN